MPAPKYVSPWSTIIIGSQELQETLADTLRGLPGADIKGTGGYGSVATARLRGSTSQQVLVLRDGMRINSPLLGLIDFNDQLLFDAERVEVVKSPLSAIYGSDAIGGAVNIISKRPVASEKKYQISLGSFDTRDVRLSLGWPGSLLSFNYLKSNGFRENSGYQGIGISEAWDVGDWGIGVRYYNADKGVPRVPDSINDPWSASTPDDRQKDENLFLNASLNSKFGAIDQKLNIYSSMMFTKYHSYDFFASLFEDTEYRGNSAGIELSHGIGTVLYGLDLRSDRGESAYIGSHEISNFALYAQNRFQKGPLGLVAGARIDNHSVSGHSVNPRIGLSYQLGEDVVLRSSYGSAFKAPTLNDLYWNDPVWQMYGNTALDPEKSRTFELGLDYSGLSINCFRTSIADLITWEWDLATNITRAKNVGAVEVSGLEMEYVRRIGRGLTGYVNATLQKDEVTADANPLNIGKTTPYSPGMKYSAGVKLNDNVKISVSHTGRRYADSGNTLEIPEHTVVNAALRREIWGYTAGLMIDNLFNEDYYESVGYHPVTFARLPYPMPGRTFTVTFGGSI